MFVNVQAGFGKGEVYMANGSWLWMRWVWLGLVFERVAGGYFSCCWLGSDGGVNDMVVIGADIEQLVCLNPKQG